MAGLAVRRPYLVALLAVALVAVLALGGQAAWRLTHRMMRPPPPPRQTDVSAIAGWMTVPYIGRTYAVPPPEIYGALGVEPEGRRTTTLDGIAAETGRTSEEVIDTVRTTVSTWQATHRPPRGAQDAPPGAPLPPTPSRPGPERSPPGPPRP